MESVAVNALINLLPVQEQRNVQSTHDIRTGRFSFFVLSPVATAKLSESLLKNIQEEILLFDKTFRFFLQYPQSSKRDADGIHLQILFPATPKRFEQGSKIRQSLITDLQSKKVVSKQQ